MRAMPHKDGFYWLLEQPLVRPNWNSAKQNASVIRAYFSAYKTNGNPPIADSRARREKLSGELAHCEHGGGPAELHEDRSDRS